MIKLKALCIAPEKSWVRRIFGVLLFLASLAGLLIFTPWNSTERLAMGSFPGYALAFLIFGFLRIEAQSERGAYILDLATGLLCLFIIVYPALPSIGSFWTLLGKWGLNYLIILFVALCIYALSASWRISVNITCGLAFLLLLANSLVFSFRGTELTTNDISAFGTAMSVVSGYSFRMSSVHYQLLLSLGLAIFLQFSVPCCKTGRSCRLRIRLISGAAALIAAVSMNLLSAPISVTFWNDTGTTVNGYLLNFLIGLQDHHVKPPENYTSEFVDALASGYENPVLTDEELPNIIVIMNETFSDLRIYPNDPKTNIPVTPFLDSLTENIVRGHALTSAFGGQTANAEFEFLTGNTMGFLPSGTVPYQQYISGNAASLGWMLKSYGYSTYMTHPYYANGWSRNTVCPALGFDAYSFLPDYPQKDLIRNFVSDREVFSGLLDRLDQQSDGPSLQFAITIQNHGGYTHPGFTPSVRLEGYDRAYPQAEQYLSLLHETDKAMEYLLTELQNREKKTIVLFFGDHQANFEPEFYQQLNGGELDTLAEQMQKYTVPFFVWANYDISEATVPLTSLNYLPIHLLQAAGLPLPAYYSALEDIRLVIPAINALGYYSPAHNTFLPLEDSTDAEKGMLDRYRCLQYNNLFDVKNLNHRFFGQYLPS